MSRQVVLYMSADGSDPDMVFVTERGFKLNTRSTAFVEKVLASVTGGLSDASKKNYRISAINFFAFLDKQNEEDGKAHVFDVGLKNWDDVGRTHGQKLPEFIVRRRYILIHRMYYERHFQTQFPNSRSF